MPGDDTCGDHSRVLIKGESQSALKNIAWVPIIQKKKVLLCHCDGILIFYF